MSPAASPGGRAEKRFDKAASLHKRQVLSLYCGTPFLHVVGLTVGKDLSQSFHLPAGTCLEVPRSMEGGYVCRQYDKSEINEDLDFLPHLESSD